MKLDTTYLDDHSIATYVTSCLQHDSRAFYQLRHTSITLKTVIYLVSRAYLEL